MDPFEGAIGRSRLFKLICDVTHTTPESSIEQVCGRCAAVPPRDSTTNVANRIACIEKE